MPLGLFLKRNPFTRGIPRFLNTNFQAKAAIQSLGKSVDVKDVLRLLRLDPESAVALFRKLNTVEEIRLDEWREHRSQVVSDVEAYKHVFNKFSAFYSEEIEWDEWKGELEDYKDPPIIMKCHIPNMISPTFFWALLENQASKNFLFDNLTMRAAISYVFWHGAIWTDVTQFILSFWGFSTPNRCAHVDTKSGLRP